VIKEFRQFIMKGNVVDLAVGVVIGVAFGTVVTALVNDIITPLIGAFGGQHDFSGLSFTINQSKFAYGHFLNALLSFLIISVVIFFFVVKPINKIHERAAKNKKSEFPDKVKCPECLSEIPKAAKRCMYCTASVAEAWF
jgi:large conductance mechanosensitive channel